MGRNRFKRFVNTSPVGNWARFFNPWKNPSSYWTGMNHEIKDPDISRIEHSHTSSAHTSFRNTIRKMMHPNKNFIKSKRKG